MCEADPAKRGPAVAADEDLYRIVTVASRWLLSEGTISSGAFNPQCFSVEIVSRTHDPDDSMSRVLDACGVIRFNCGCARQNGLDARDERDEAHPENLAHAHVYNDLPNNQRKKAAKRFLSTCSHTIERNKCPESTQDQP
jgi:hypothetical protein